MKTYYKEAILSSVKTTVEKQLFMELENTKHYTGHSLVIKDLDDVKRNIVAYTMDLMDIAERRMTLLALN